SSGPSGIDPYAAAVSDVYQDLFGEGSYTGKGIYDVDAFEAALAGRVPENALLSHDLFEGLFARAGLVTDVELFESAPSHYGVAAARQPKAGLRVDLGGFYQRMGGGVALAVAGAAAIAWGRPTAWPVALPFLLLWAASPVAARSISVPSPAARTTPLSPADARAL